MRTAIFLIALLAANAAEGAEPLRLALPVACETGKTCWVQQYPDRDPTSAVRDYACGAQTYDGHDGTDIRVLDTTSMVDVVAAAGGVVKAARNTVADHLMRTPEDRKAVGNRECGNGAVIDHGGGWETQYCHLRQGSVAVKPGDRVQAGTRLGLVGYSGMAAFPHVHLTVRQDGIVRDPFRVANDTTSCGAGGDMLWTEAAQGALQYRKAQVLKVGFAPGTVDLRALETGTATTAAIAGDWPGLVVYAWAINLASGDEISLKLEGPDGVMVQRAITLDRAKAQYLQFTGTKRPGSVWPKGEYRGTVEIRNGAELLLRQSLIQQLD